MIIREVGSRGVLFTFDDKEHPYIGDTSVYLINAGNYFFVCDTHLGPISMEPVKHYMAQQAGKKQTVIFNSHSDWDHVWGNCAFEKPVIIGHETCRRRLQEIGGFELQSFLRYHNGDIKLMPPNLTFATSVRYEDEEVEFIYAPGHTVDSSICFDIRDSVLYAGDLLEYPIPYLDFLDLEAYVRSLEFIKNLHAKIVISAHSGIVDEKLFDDNTAYVKNVFSGRPVDLKGKDGQSVHDFNIKNLLLLKCEKIVREKLKQEFDYNSFRKEFSNIDRMSYEDLEKALGNYIEWY